MNTSTLMPMIPPMSAPMAAPSGVERKPPMALPDFLITIAGMGMAILVFVGLLSFQAILLIQPPASPFGGGTPTASAVAYANLVRTLAWVSMSVLDAATAVVVGFAFLASTSRATVPDSARRGLYVFSTVFLVGWMFLSYLFMSTISSMLRIYGA